MATSLAVRIARCDRLSTAFVTAGDPCHEVVKYQTFGAGCRAWQVPEPWRGDLAGACLLFVSSNPSTDPLDDCPWNTDTNQRIDSYFNSSGIAANFPHSTSAVGQRSKGAVSFWMSINRYAIELFGHNNLLPGVHYAITEVVHCKSRDEVGVNAALPQCSGYMPDILRSSGANVVVWLGSHAQKAAASLKGQLVNSRGTSPLELRLPHPNSRGQRGVACLSDNERALAMRALSSCQVVTGAKGNGP
ncbi:conserved hypothetical protein [Rubrivivax sp. A210]|nr:conserved hypothetical protein [Rubrivivax sp. A210]